MRCRSGCGLLGCGPKIGGMTLMQQQITQLLRNQEVFSGRFKQLEDQVQDHDRRIIKLEVKE